jgi:hypothetical protein
MRRGSCLLIFVVALFTLIFGGIDRAWGSTATVTTLVATSNNGSLSSLPPHSVVQLTASVTAAGAPVYPGMVLFCDAGATHCTGSHLFGSAQVTYSGTATLRFIPGVGIHSYYAVFVGTTVAATSTSTEALVTVRGTGTNASTTTITASGAPGNYTLTATVAVPGASIYPTGIVSFLDTTNGDSVLGSSHLVPGSSGLSWVNSSTPSTGLAPTGAAVADFNNDGIPDLAVVNDDSNTLTILLGKGDGTFTPAPSPATGTFPIVTASADFNSDGNVDLVVVNLGDTGFPPLSNSNVTILLGNGDGTFTPAPSVGVGSAPESVAVGDFNRDGRPDLAVANFNSDTVTILLGNGDGSFQPRAETSPTGNAPIAIVTGDFNADRVPDLAVANMGSAPTILLGNGDGSFRQGVSPATPGATTEGIAIADFNGDGIPDLATRNNAGTYLTVFLGNGDGTFLLRSTPAVPFIPQTLVTGDFNGDGIPDMAITVDYPSSEAIFLLGNGDGTFDAASSTPATGVSHSDTQATVGDFNGDGLSDLAVDNSDQNTVTVLLSETGSTASASVNGIAPVGTGTHFANASYPGDSTYAASVSSTIPLVAQSPAPGSVSLTATPNPVAIFSPVMLQYAVSAAGTAPTGTMTLADSGATFTTLKLPPASGTYSTSFFPTGVHTITGTYSGDTTYAAASRSVPITVTPLASTLTLGASTNPATFGQGFILKAQLSANATLTSVQMVELFSGCQIVITGLTPSPIFIPVSGTGVATANFPAVSSLPAGIYTAMATFSGNTNLGASSATLIVTVNPAQTTTTLNASATTLTTGQSVLLTAMTRAPAGATGRVVFRDGIAIVGTVPLISGSASLPVAGLAIGAHSLIASYSGDPSDASSVSPPVQVQVLASAIALQLSSSSLTLRTGHHANLSVTVTSLGGASGPVSLSATLLPAYGTAKFSPAQLELQPGQAHSSNLYVDTDAVLGYLSLERKHSTLWPGSPLLAFLPVGLLVGLRRRRRLLLLASLGLICSLGCSGKYPASTAPGTYLIQINAITSGNATSISVPLKLTVTE